MDKSNISELNPKKDKLARLLSFLPHDKDNVSLIYDTLSLALSLGEYEAAIGIVAQYEEVPENDPQLHAIFGHLNLYLGKYEKALQSLQTAIDSGIEQNTLQLDLAQCYHYLKNPDKTREILLDNENLSKDFPEIYYPLLARACYASEESTKAIEQLELFHEIRQPTAESAGLLALLLFEEDTKPELALELASNALELNEKALEARLARSMLLFDDRQFDKATADINKALEFHPTSGRAWSSLAQFEFNNFHFAEAKSAAEQAVLYMNDHVGTWHMLGWSCLMLDELDQAKSAFEYSYDLDRRFAETHGGLAAVFAHQGEIKKANNHLKIAEKLDPTGFAATYAKMVLLNKNNEPEKAKALFEKSKQLLNKRTGITPQSLIEKRMLELFENDRKPKN